MAQEKEAYVVRGATLKCNKGTMTSKIMIPLCHGVYIGGKPQLNINDYKLGENISHFGLCKSSIPDDPRPEGVDEKGNIVRVCIAEFIGPWEEGHQNKLIEGIPALTDKCKNHCFYGGEITVEEHYQKEE
jgi:hypothetical protein